ncbi:hypothetical protein KJ877_04270 [bacterium]|nr:hypothetical protein [bacterium]MBU1991022.1 hypothetical protein [bacterium]
MKIIYFILLLTSVSFTACESQPLANKFAQNYLKGAYAYNDRNYQNSIEYLKKNSDNNKKLDEISEYYKIESQFFIGSVYFNKLHDSVNGLRYLELAADNGNPRALESLTALYRDGLFGIPKNTTLAMEYFIKIENAKKIWAEKEQHLIEWSKKQKQ